MTGSCDVSSSQVSRGFMRSRIHGGKSGRGREDVRRELKQCEEEEEKAGQTMFGARTGAARPPRAPCRNGASGTGLGRMRKFTGPLLTSEESWSNCGSRREASCGSNLVCKRTSRHRHPKF
ncbi:hypothetical protein CISG_02629 [Coccidioides immitis RMSCC 3703]|uniref:Uncharacterized protein n=2 Tax=Coccidioides immitis TaxID=5501 RepID=A0A0J8U3E4_COCIT|nr:hypothetical protein CIRG_09090 [Coccidioides immitis RMSCC 2394]KMU81252.1 hypothetical protein CISG_02629 [Coccidioides immitis RMSCC 3703]